VRDIYSDVLELAGLAGLSFAAWLWQGAALGIAVASASAILLGIASAGGKS